MSENLDALFLEAAKLGDKQSVARLLDQGADVNANGDWALRTASQSGQEDIVDLLLARGATVSADNDYSLRWSAAMGHNRIAANLLDHGADIHADNDGALRGAATASHPETVTLLLDRGASVHALHDYALRWAAQGALCVEVVSRLLDRVDYSDDNIVASMRHNLRESKFEWVLALVDARLLQIEIGKRMAGGEADVRPQRVVASVRL